MIKSADINADKLMRLRSNLCLWGEAPAYSGRGKPRDIVNDNPLPWQKQMIQLTPGRVAQAMPGILVRVSTPAKAPKPRGKSPGWKTGQKRQRRIRYPIVKKRTSPSRKSQAKTA